MCTLMESFDDLFNSSSNSISTNSLDSISTTPSSMVLSEPLTAPLTSEQTSNSSSSSISTSEPKRKRHQVKLACIPCRKRHSACEDSRPCKQCVKHGVQDQCTDKPRQKRRASIDMGVIKQSNPVINLPGDGQTKQNSNSNINGRRSWSVDFTNMNPYYKKDLNNNNQKKTTDIYLSDNKIDMPTNKLNQAFDHCTISNSTVSNWKYPVTTTISPKPVTNSTPNNISHQRNILNESLSYDSVNDNTNNHCLNLQQQQNNLLIQQQQQQNNLLQQQQQNNLLQQQQQQQNNMLQQQQQNNLLQQQQNNLLHQQQQNNLLQQQQNNLLHQQQQQNNIIQHQQSNMIQQQQNNINMLHQPQSHFNFLGYKSSEIESFVLNNNQAFEAVTIPYKVLRDLFIDNSKYKKKLEALTEENNVLKRTINDQQQQIQYLSAPPARSNGSPPLMNLPNYPPRNFVKVQNFTTSEVELPPSLQNSSLPINIPTSPGLLAENSGLPRGSYPPPNHNDHSNHNPLRHSMPYRIEHPGQFLNVPSQNELSKSNPRGNMAHRNSDSHLRNDPSVLMAAAGQNRATGRPNDFQRVMAQLELTPSEDFSDTDDTTSLSSIWNQYQTTPAKGYPGNVPQTQQLYRASLYPTAGSVNGKHNVSPLVPPQTNLDIHPNGSRMSYNYNM